MNTREHTLGEFLIAASIGLVAAAFAAVAAFVGVIFVCARLFTGEASYSSLGLAPVSSLAAGVVVFALVFRAILHYGDPPASRE